MIIETKFNYHNVIWVVKKEEKFDKEGHLHINWYVEKRLVDFIMVAYNGEALGVRYTHDLYFEQDCFVTQNEAQKECDRRKNGSK